MGCFTCYTSQQSNLIQHVEMYRAQRQADYMYGALRQYLRNFIEHQRTRLDIAIRKGSFSHSWWAHKFKNINDNDAWCRIIVEMELAKLAEHCINCIESPDERGANYYTAKLKELIYSICEYDDIRFSQYRDGVTQAKQSLFCCHMQQLRPIIVGRGSVFYELPYHLEKIQWPSNVAQIGLDTFVNELSREASQRALNSRNQVIASGTIDRMIAAENKSENAKTPIVRLSTLLAWLQSSDVNTRQAASNHEACQLLVNVLSQQFNMSLDEMLKLDYEIKHYQHVQIPGFMGEELMEDKGEKARHAENRALKKKITSAYIQSFAKEGKDSLIDVNATHAEAKYKREGEFMSVIHAS